jgi:uncharacterized protein (TIGR02466 family)
MKHEQTLALFISPVSIFNLDLDITKVLKVLKKSKWTRVNRMASSKEQENLYTTPHQILSKLPQLSKEINEACQSYIDNVLQMEGKARVANSWGVKAAPRGFGAPHYHSNSWISGTYYPETNSAFAIRFNNPHKFTWHGVPKSYNTYNSGSWTIKPRANQLILFPSLLSHEVSLNHSNQDRYSIAFNMVPTGKFGYDDSMVTF